jgi:hypothetical protein
MASSPKTLNILYNGFVRPELTGLLESIPGLTYHKAGLTTAAGLVACRIVAVLAWSANPADFESLKKLESGLSLLRASGAILGFSIKM